MSNGVVSVNFDLSALKGATQRKLAEVMRRDVAPHALRESVRNAPVSPTNAQINQTLVRKKRTSRRQTPHGLEKSIRADVELRNGEVVTAVYVPKNAPAGKYARYIHDLKGVKWRKRGLGTVRKGARADEKFIERAVRENEQKYFAAIQRAVGAALK